MRDGLDFNEVYDDATVSDVVEMLFGEGQADMAAFAAARPWRHPPDTVFNYSSGTSNIVSGIVARELGPGEPYRRFLHERLFGPLGMRSADPRFDEAGTFLRSSFVYATAPDYLRFGLLYLRDGVWEGRRSCPRAGSTTPAASAATTPTRTAGTGPTGGASATTSARSGPAATRASRSWCARRST